MTALPYVTKLGFYSDDWYILSTFQTDLANHRFGLSSALRGFEARPVQGLYLAALFRLFALHPLGYHLVNLTVIVASIASFYALLVRLQVGRATAMAAAIVLAVLPQLSTVRAWYAAFQIPLSMLAMLISLHCQLSFANSGKLRWALGSLISALVSVAAYEIFAPFIAAFPLGLLLRQGIKDLRARRTVAIALPLAAVILLTLAKVALTNRVPSGGLAVYGKGLLQFVRPDYDWRTDNSLNVFAAVSVHFGWPIIGAGRALSALVNGQIGMVDLLASAAAAMLSFLALKGDWEEVNRPWGNGRLFLFGAAVFLLGHAAFLITPAILFSPAGPANRVLVAAAMGVTIIYVALARSSVRAAGAKTEQIIFAALISIFVFFGTLRIEQIEGYWTGVPVIQAPLLEAARMDLRSVPPGAVVVVENVCPYNGPAVVLEAPWDVSGILSLAANRPIRGDAVSRRMRVDAEGLSTSIFGEAALYPFGAALYVYDPKRHLVVQLPNRQAAIAYFDAARLTQKPCAKSYPGHGVLI